MLTPLLRGTISLHPQPHLSKRSSPNPGVVECGSTTGEATARSVSGDPRLCLFLASLSFCSQHNFRPPLELVVVVIATPFLAAQQSTPSSVSILLPPFSPCPLLQSLLSTFLFCPTYYHRLNLRHHEWHEWSEPGSGDHLLHCGIWWGSVVCLGDCSSLFRIRSTTVLRHDWAGWIDASSVHAISPPAQHRANPAADRISSWVSDHVRTRGRDIMWGYESP